jgi:hypothetical protein
MKLAIASALLIVLVSSSALQAAAPRLLIIYGNSLREPVLLQDWGEIFKMFTSTPAETGLSLKDRPFLEIAMFWGPEWSDYVNKGKPLDKIRPQDANQQGRFYPAFGDSPALISFGPTVKRIALESLQFLDRSGVLTRLALSTNRSR